MILHYVDTCWEYHRYICPHSGNHDEWYSMYKLCARNSIHLKWSWSLQNSQNTMQEIHDDVVEVSYTNCLMRLISWSTSSWASVRRAIALSSSIRSLATASSLSEILTLRWLNSTPLDALTENIVSVGHEWFQRRGRCSWESIGRTNLRVSFSYVCHFEYIPRKESAGMEESGRGVWTGADGEPKEMLHCVSYLTNYHLYLLTKPISHSTWNVV